MKCRLMDLNWAVLRNFDMFFTHFSIATDWYPFCKFSSTVYSNYLFCLEKKKNAKHPKTLKLLELNDHISTHK